MKNKKATKGNLTKGLLFTVGELYVLYLAINGHGAAENIMAFWCIFAGVCGIILALAQNTAVKVSTIKPVWFNSILNVADAGIVIALASQGWFWCTSMFIVGMLGASIVKMKLDEKIKTETQPNPTAHQGG